MPRERAKLSEKEQRILVQAQLMGLTTESMVRIGNRLKALDKERDFRSQVAEFTSGFNWTVKSSREFAINDNDGKIYEVKITKDPNQRNWSNSCAEYARIIITKPGTRFKPRTIYAHRIDNPFNEEVISVCPERNKFLFRIMRDIKNGKIDR